MTPAPHCPVILTIAILVHVQRQLLLRPRASPGLAYVHADLSDLIFQFWFICLRRVANSSWSVVALPCADDVK